MLKVANEGTLLYPNDTMLGRVTSAYANIEEPTFDYNQYESNGSVTAQVSIDNVEVSSNDILTAYIDGEVRGQASPLLSPINNEYVFGLMVYGDEVTNNIEFEYYNYTNGKTYDLDHDISGFESDMIVGTYASPYVMGQLDEFIPVSYSLEKAYPNPFNPSTTIGYALSNSANVDITVYDISGRVVENLVSGYKTSGSHEIVLIASSMASGFYFVQLNVNGFVDNQKLLLIK